MKIFSIVLFLSITGCKYLPASTQIEGYCEANKDGPLLAKTKMRILKSYKPSYPTSPSPNINLKGCVKLSFTLSKKGIIDDIKVKNSYPTNMFNRSAIKALKKYKFNSSEKDIDNGLVVITFKLE